MEDEIYGTIAKVVAGETLSDGLEGGTREGVSVVGPVGRTRAIYSGTRGNCSGSRL